MVQDIVQYMVQYMVHGTWYMVQYIVQYMVQYMVVKKHCKYYQHGNSQGREGWRQREGGRGLLYPY